MEDHLFIKYVIFNPSLTNLIHINAADINLHINVCVTIICVGGVVVFVGVEGGGRNHGVQVLQNLSF